MPYDYKKELGAGSFCRQKSGKKGKFVTKKTGDSKQKCWKSKTAYLNSKKAQHAQGLGEYDLHGELGPKNPFKNLNKKIDVNTGRPLQELKNYVSFQILEYYKKKKPVQSIEDPSDIYYDEYEEFSEQSNEFGDYFEDDEEDEDWDEEEDEDCDEDF